MYIIYIIRDIFAKWAQHEPRTHSQTCQSMTFYTFYTFHNTSANCQCSKTKLCVKFEKSARNLVISFSGKSLNLFQKGSDFKAKMYQIQLGGLGKLTALSQTL